MKSFTEKHLILIAVLLLNLYAVDVLAAETDYNLGLAAYEKKSFAEATTHFEKYLKANAPSPRPVLYAALSNLQSGNRARAKQLFEYLVTAFPNTKESELASTALSNTFGATKPSQPSHAVKAPANNSEEPDESDREFASLPDSAEIKFNTNASGHMQVDAYINGHLIPCWFDTGAEEVLSVDQLRAAGIAPPTGKPDTYSVGWAGKPIPVWYKEATVKIGGITRTLPLAVAADYGGLPPLVGQGFLKGYQYSIDNAGGRMLLTKKTAKGVASRAINPLYDIPCVVEDDREYVTITVNGRQIKHVLIDTGASNTILSYDVARAAGLDTTGAPAFAFSGVGGSVIMREVTADVRLGPITKTDFPIQVGGRAGNAIGQDFMSGWRFTVDRDAKLLRFFH